MNSLGLIARYKARYKANTMRFIANALFAVYGCAVGSGQSMVSRSAVVQRSVTNSLLLCLMGLMKKQVLRYV